MFHDILIPVDLSEKNEAAVQAVLEIARPADATIRLLHVVETIQDVPFEELDDFYNGLRKRAEQSMLRWSTALTDQGFEVRLDILFGNRAREILRYANDEGCDLIVLHSHRLDLEHPGAGLGTISQQIAVVAPCTVLLLRPPPVNGE